jgi:Uma2 family endonuclease
MSEQTELQIDSTPEAFLAHAERHPDTRFDFIDGELVEMSPKPLHGRIQVDLVMFLGSWLAKNPIGDLYTEVLYVLDGQKFIPDVSISSGGSIDDPYFTAPPLLAIEIRADTQSRAAQRRKARDYIARGTAAVLLVFPGEWIELFTADEVKVFKAGEIVKGIPGVSGLEIAVTDFLGRGK